MTFEIQIKILEKIFSRGFNCTVACEDDAFEGTTYPDLNYRPGTETPKEERTEKHIDPVDLVDLEYQTIQETDTVEKYSTEKHTDPVLA